MAGRKNGSAKPLTNSQHPSREGRNLALPAEVDQDREIVDALTVAAYTTDDSGVITGYNSAAAELWGRNPKLGKDLWCGSWRLYWPDGSPMAHDECPMAITLRENRAVRGKEIVVERPDGSRAWILPYPSPLRNARGTLVGAVNVLIDATERKQAERELQERARQQAAVAALGQLALTSVVVQSLMDEAVQVVAQTLHSDYCKVLELLPGGERLLLRAGVGWKQGLVGAKTVSAGKSQAGYTLRSSEPVIVEDLRAEKRFDGPPLLHDHGVISGMSVIIEGHDAPYGVLGVHSKSQRPFTPDDINFLQSVANVLAQAVERKRVEAELRKANQSKDEFIGFVSHQLRTPITVIFGDVRLLRARREQIDENTASELLLDLETYAGRLRTIVDDLLILARLDAKQEIALEPVLLQRLIAQIAQNYFEPKSRHLEVNVYGDLRPVRAEPSYLDQVMRNILSNAEKYSTPGSPIDVEVKAGKDHVLVSVLDRGQGLAPEEAKRIFEPFYRSVSVPSQTSGAGLGLAVCRRLTEAQGGSIWAEPRTGGGLAVSFTLPFYDEDQSLPE